MLNIELNNPAMNGGETSYRCIKLKSFNAIISWLYPLYMQDPVSLALHLNYQQEVTKCVLINPE